MLKTLKQLGVKELASLLKQIENDPVEIAMLLFPHRPEVRLELTEMIGEWALFQKMVLESNADDMPHIAIVFEKSAHRIWQQLPEYARQVFVDTDKD